MAFGIDAIHVAQNRIEVRAEEEVKAGNVVARHGVVDLGRSGHVFKEIEVVAKVGADQLGACVERFVGNQNRAEELVLEADPLQGHVNGFGGIFLLGEVFNVVARLLIIYCGVALLINAAAFKAGHFLVPVELHGRYSGGNNSGRLHGVLNNVHLNAIAVGLGQRVAYAPPGAGAQIELHQQGRVVFNHRGEVEAAAFELFAVAAQSERIGVCVGVPELNERSVGHVDIAIIIFQRNVADLTAAGRELQGQHVVFEADNRVGAAQVRSEVAIALKVGNGALERAGGIGAGQLVGRVGPNAADNVVYFEVAGGGFNNAGQQGVLLQAEFIGLGCNVAVAVFVGAAIEGQAVAERGNVVGCDFRDCQSLLTLGFGATQRVNALFLRFLSGTLHFFGGGLVEPHETENNRAHQQDAG